MNDLDWRMTELNVERLSGDGDTLNIFVVLFLFSFLPISYIASCHSSQYRAGATFSFDGMILNYQIFFLKDF